VGSEEGCGSGHLGRGGDVEVAAVRMGLGGDGACLGFRRKTKGGRLIGWARLSVTGGGGVGWNGRRRKGGGPQLGRKPEMVQSSRIKILSNFIWNLDFWHTLEICTRRFRRNFNMGIFPKIF
jgi:hypothetical protein